MGLKEIGYGIDLTVSKYGSMVGSCEHCDKPLGYIKSDEFLDDLKKTIIFSRMIMHQWVTESIMIIW